MSASDRERWDARFADGRLAEPAPPDALVGREHLLPAAGRALDVACGRGEVAVWLAARGLAVDAVDVSPVGLAAGRARPGGEAVRWIEADLAEGLPVAGPYDVVVCQRFRDPRLYPALTAALAPGGLLVVTVLSGSGGPFRAPPGELLAAFGHLAVLHQEESGGRASLVARAAAGDHGR
ncbi:class I SAM-dependent methyltransferase [Actinomycetospora cinnamomea]|uniref:Methyltransferase family protein n=1 Tax=Actinomycetospora cinnamomea TaxID=663609 RepID=A0A2U1FHS6_9PSEU|nr:class I SAM-dependent methyltransferase [Actinomycetospora cinnamomea]PVZ11717.1 methyltransferase family protein [Actinomycetospora cinnamomea]